MAKNCQWFQSFIITKKVPFYASRDCGDLMVWSLVDNWEVVSSNPTAGDRAWEAMVGPTVGSGNFRVVKVDSEKNILLIFYLIFLIILF